MDGGAGGQIAGTCIAFPLARAPRIRPARDVGGEEWQSSKIHSGDARRRSASLIGIGLARPPAAPRPRARSGRAAPPQPASRDDRPREALPDVLAALCELVRPEHRRLCFLLGTAARKRPRATAPPRACARLLPGDRRRHIGPTVGSRHRRLSAPGRGVRHDRPLWTRSGAGPRARGLVGGRSDPRDRRPLPRHLRDVLPRRAPQAPRDWHLVEIATHVARRRDRAPSRHADHRALDRASRSRLSTALAHAGHEMIVAQPRPCCSQLTTELCLRHRRHGLWARLDVLVPAPRRLYRQAAGALRVTRLASGTIAPLLHGLQTATSGLTRRSPIEAPASSRVRHHPQPHVALRRGSR
jgi:hypothetical protein